MGSMLTESLTNALKKLGFLRTFSEIKQYSYTVSVNHQGSELHFD
jgi:hypothetical protein